MGIYVFDADFHARALRLDALSTRSRHDFGADVLPRLIREADAFAWRLRAADGVEPAYWRDIGTIGAYWCAHLELLGPSPRVRLDDPDWPLPAVANAPSMIGRLGFQSQRGSVQDSLIARGCTIGGTVQHSVLFEGVEVRRNAEIVDAVILPGAVIGNGCRRGVIVDSGSRIPGRGLKPAVLTADEAKHSVSDLAYALA